MTIKQRLDKLRTIMNTHQVDLYLVPTTDAHCDEYPPTCWLRRLWISGFKGSAGEALITQEHAYLWTDGRYYLQAKNELDEKEYTMMQQASFTPETESWLQANANGKTLGIDPRVLSISRAQRLQHILSSSGGKLKFIDDNLIDQCRIQSGEELALPASQAFISEEKYTGMSIAQKLHWLQNELKKHHVTHIVLSALDEIAWLFNMRGSDVTFNPLIISYAIIGIDSAHLFVDRSKINDSVKNTLQRNGVELREYDDFADGLKDLHGTIWLDDKIISYWIYRTINEKNQFKLAASPIIHKKACKNAAEVDGARLVHIKDSVALMNFFCWLKNNWQSGVSELSCAQKLTEFRSQAENYIGLSFDVMSGFADNGAIIHYRVAPETSKTITDKSLFLVDSGSQYLEGTTDVTRTLHLGKPTAEQKRHYTLVLKGHLAVGRAVFSGGTCGEHLDALARTPLWNEYLNYRHGTGHGVGSYLCVHEGPQKISQVNTGIPLVPGMIVSNEPGLYLSGKYGIRIENLCLVTEVDNEQAKSSEYGPFYKFETLTMLPYCSALIDMDILTNEETVQLRDYYQLVKTRIRHLLSDPVRDWLDDELKAFI